MKTTKKFWHYSIALVVTTSLLLSSCEKENEISVPVLTTAEVTEITQSTAISGGNITDNGGGTVTSRGVCWSTSQNPTISDNKTDDSDGTGSYSSSITNLEPNTLYYVRAYATNSAGTSYGNQVNFQTIENSIIYGDGITDIDGNEYITVIIGEQEWMAENLKTSKYSNGDEIPNITGWTDWGNLTTGGWSHYDNEPSRDETYGKLYNWYAVIDTRGLCPAGWIIPSDNNWKQLEMYLGMTQEQANSTGGRGTDEGGKMKSISTEPNPHPRWDSPNTGATNERGFSGLPGGYRSGNGNFFFIGEEGLWWSISDIEHPTLPSAWNRRLVNAHSKVTRSTSDKQNGFSVRCLKDN
ncbi:MAG: fibrobacter succinogenes major paralogous domain-containing protein [Perlabentimonas sp.]